jgi:hypothetical protein
MTALQALLARKARKEFLVQRLLLVVLVQKVLPVLLDHKALQV